MRDETVTAGDEIVFGPFVLAPRKRLLSSEGVPVELGARALDILIALTAKPNQIISKKDLLARAWPDITVEEGSLRFHMANLRKALADGKEGARYIATLTGRGYCFVAPISRPSDQSAIRGEGRADFTHANLPSRLIRMVGRDDVTCTLSAQLLATRFVTILGAGGVGKTTVAVALGHDLIEAFAGAVQFIDLGALSDPRLVATTIASILGLSVQSDDAIPGLCAYLADKRILLILDTCEHVIEAAAALASRIYTAAPQVHILATSREALRVEGEHVHKLTTLACPPDDPLLTTAVAETFAATQLFVERANSSGAQLKLRDAEAAIVASICRKLDGVPLAIELAAARVGGLGLERTAALLDHRLTLSWQGQRTAPQRQQTLQAAIDWSYQLLSQLERIVLHRLAVFVGHFTIEAALAVVTSPSIDQTLVFGIIDSLVAKSMVATAPVGATIRYRLLDTTRAYALETGTDETELSDLVERHATYYLGWLEETGDEWPSLESAAQRALHLAGLANARAALESCFDSGGSTEIAVRLAVAAAPVFLSMSLLTECHRWSERALLALDCTVGHERDAMHLLAASGVSLMFTLGGKDAARVALKRSFAIAEEYGGPLDQLQVLGPLQMFHLRTGEFKAALNYAKHCSTVARALEDTVSVTLAHSLMGISLHLGGQLDAAHTELESALVPGPLIRHNTTLYLGFDSKVLAGAILARNLWLQGFADQALERVNLTLSEAANKDHPLTLSIALIWAASLLLWTGDLDGADQYIDWLLSRAEPHSLGPYLAVARGLKGELAVRRGHARDGIGALQEALEKLHAAPYELLTTPLNIALVQGLAATNRFDEAFSLIDTTIELVESRGDLCYMPELLRVRGNLSLKTPQASVDEAERCIQSSIKLSQRQGARAWELRAGTDLAQLYVDRGQTDHAQALLQLLCEQVVDGLSTADVRAATDLLATLR
ncbi:ATP-binding protein [Phyllobacterium lublinensis]|uniref:ATP-binding protein n=1 Tax=Phyllobacterium lublinensis TaxID=2875708 RepID=UPI001CC991E8|nr:winged helix-turn-helix domain-containing protein [Phyllobacterium sp. 2063]MBZ9656909.1 helix-turn-helix transcriptional regulator [Phyllobacterium sp. 2063]